MSADSVWDQKHAATSSIQSSDLLGAYGGEGMFTINMNFCRLSQWYEPTERGFRSMSKSTEYTPDGRFVKETVIEGAELIYDEPEPQGFWANLSSLFT